VKVHRRMLIILAPGDLATQSQVLSGPLRSNSPDNIQQGPVLPGPWAGIPPSTFFIFSLYSHVVGIGAYTRLRNGPKRRLHCEVFGELSGFIFTCIDGGTQKRI
jgi:hypothetical protein